MWRQVLGNTMFFVRRWRCRVFCPRRTVDKVPGTLHPGKLTWKLHPWRLTWNIIMEVWKIMFLSKWVMAVGSMLIFQGVNITHLKRSHYLPSTFTLLGPTCEFLPGVQLCRLCFDLHSMDLDTFSKSFKLWNATCQQHKILSPKCLVICFHHNTSGFPVYSFFFKVHFFFS